MKTSRKNIRRSKLRSNHRYLVLPLGARGLQHANTVACHLVPQLLRKRKTKLTPGLTCSRASLHTHLPREQSAARQARRGHARSERTAPPPSWDCSRSTLGTPSAHDVKRGGAGGERLRSKWVITRSCLARTPTGGSLHIHHSPQINVLGILFLMSRL